MNILIRDVPEDTARKLDEEANNSGLSRQAFLLRLLHERYEPPAVVGWIKLDRPGDLDEESECPECGQALDWPWLAILSNGAWTGPVCSACATSE